MNKEIFDMIEVPLLNIGFLFFYAKDGENITKHLNKKKNKYASDWLKKHTTEFDLKGCAGCLIYKEEDNLPLILYIKAGKKDWNLFQTVIHETSHLVDRLFKKCQIGDETEFRAYMTEHLFKVIRKKIQ